MSEERIGTILHFSPLAGSAQIELSARDLRVGDVIRIKGQGHDFVQEVESLEIDRLARRVGHRGERVAIAVMEPVQEKAEVWRLSRSPDEASA